MIFAEITTFDIVPSREKEPEPERKQFKVRKTERIKGIQPAESIELDLRSIGMVKVAPSTGDDLMIKLHGIASAVKKKPYFVEVANVAHGDERRRFVKVRAIEYTKDDGNVSCDIFIPRGIREVKIEARGFNSDVVIGDIRVEKLHVETYGAIFSQAVCKDARYDAHKQLYIEANLESDARIYLNQSFENSMLVTSNVSQIVTDDLSSFHSDQITNRASLVCSGEGGHVLTIAGSISFGKSLII